MTTSCAGRQSWSLLAHRDIDTVFSHNTHSDTRTQTEGNKSRIIYILMRRRAARMLCHVADV